MRTGITIRGYRKNYTSFQFQKRLPLASQWLHDNNKGTDYDIC